MVSGCASSDVSVRSESESLSLLLLSIEDSLLLLNAANFNSEQLYAFAIKIKLSPPINHFNKCRYLFPYFPSLESRLAGEQTVFFQESTTTDRPATSSDYSCK
jgi:hypothetical protein